MRYMQMLPALVLACAACAGEGGNEQPAMTEEMKAAMAKMQPGKEHEAFQKRTGSFDVVQKMWMEPGAEAMESKGSSEFKLIFGGRFLQNDFKGTMMGQPFEGVGLCGFNRVSGKYEMCWYDSSGTGIWKMDGTSDDGGKSVTYTTQYLCPMLNVPVSARVVMNHESEDKFTMTWFDTYQGKPEHKSMEVVYTRK